MLLFVRRFFLLIETNHVPCVTTSIPEGFHLVLPVHPFTHIAPRLSTGIVPSPSPNLTPDRTSGIEPLTVTSESIRCRLARGKSRGVRSVVHELLETLSSDGSHCQSDLKHVPCSTGRDLAEG